MRSLKTQIVCRGLPLVVVLLTHNSCAQAATNESPQEASVRWMDAIRSDDRELRTSVIHSTSRACMTPQNRVYFDRFFAWQRRAIGSGKFRVEATPAAKLGSWPAEMAKAGYPTPPQYMIRITISDGTSTGSLDTFFAYEGGKLLEILPCPTPELTEKLERQAVEEAGHDRRVTTGVSGIPDQLRSRLTALLAEGRKVEAIRLYAAETGSDIMTAKDVIERLSTE